VVVRVSTEPCGRAGLALSWGGENPDTLATRPIGVGVGAAPAAGAA